MAPQRKAAKMAPRRRGATFDAVLVYLDEPQVITLISLKTRVVAVAVPSENQDASLFLAVTTSQGDWERYLEGRVDLRYLFTFPLIRTLYLLDLNDLGPDDRIMMVPVEGKAIDEARLPSPRFFSTNHTQEYETPERAEDREHLIIDGEWELTDLGQFQQRFSEIYSFLGAIENWNSGGVEDKIKRRIKDAFLDRPFRGGFSYVHLFKDLEHSIPRHDQINLNAIQYASPGKVEMFGREQTFDGMREVVHNFLANHESISKTYNGLYKYLSQNKYLQMSGHHYAKNDPTAKFISESAKKLAEAMLAPDIETVSKLTDENALVSAKVVMSFYRRLADTAMYFAQGRISY